MNKTLFSAASALLIGCAPMVPKETHTLLSHQYVDRVVDGCPTAEPLSYRAAVHLVIDKHEGGIDPVALQTALHGLCVGLDTQQQRGYWLLLDAAWRQYEHDYRAIASGEHQRRAGSVVTGGRVVMEAGRTDSLDRIRRNQERF